MGPPAFQAYRSARLVASCLRQSRASKPLSKNIAIAASQRASISSKPKPALPRSSTIPPAPAARVAPASKNANHGVIDPQAAIPEASTVADVDPTLAAEIPTSDSNSSGTPLSPAFAAALSGSGSGNGNGNGNGTGPNGQAIDWSSSFHGLSTTPFSPETAAVLMQALDPIDIEIKPDGIIYLPEIKYRRILNKAFGPGGWGLAPRGELIVGEKVVTREYALVVHGRFIAQARGECQYFSEETIPTAGEGCKSNALLRCCKDLGIASELWDPRFIRAFKKAHCHEIWVEHVATKKRRQIWVRKDSDPAYPYQAVRSTGARV